MSFITLRIPHQPTLITRFPSRLLGKGDHIGYTLGMNCFRHAMGAERRRFDTDDDSEREEEQGDGAAGWGDGGVDCELLVAGSYLHAHRVILARRSPVLRDMIAQVRLARQMSIPTVGPSDPRSAPNPNLNPKP